MECFGQDREHVTRSFPIGHETAPFRVFIDGLMKLNEAVRNENRCPQAGRWSRALRLLLVSAAIGLLAETSPVAAETGSGVADNDGSGALDDRQALAAGDRLSLRIEEDRSEAKLLTISDSGEIDIPHLGRLLARDRTCRALALEIKQKLEAKYYYKATVVLSIDILNRVRGSVYLFGEVRGSGALGIPSDETLTLAKAVIRAGGFTDFADKRKVKLTREPEIPGQNPVVMVIDAAEIMERGALEKDIKLQRGDRIFVPARAINF